MTETALEPKPSDTITVIEGFDAMRVFLATVWQRQGKASMPCNAVVNDAG
jgi:hypothetical protein